MENKTQPPFVFKISFEITYDMFEIILVGALEGGSNYWYQLHTDEFRKDLVGSNDEPLSTRIAMTLFTKPDFKMNVYDVESEEDVALGVLTQESMLEAFQIIHTKWNWHFNNLVTDNHDAETSDVFFQVAIMKDIVFG